MIPFNVPYVPEASKRYVLEALESKHQQGDGPFTAKASQMVSDLVGGGHVLLTPSCTHALEMASMLANLGPGDEVILPSYTFTSAATAVTKFGATPVFVDIEMETKGIDVNQVREAITPRTKAISWVNYAGVAPDIEGLQSLAKEFDLILIEDNAHGLGGSYKGKPLGSFGDFATQSFHATKNIQCGEGGALVINNEKYIERAEIIREKGTNRTQFIAGKIDKYKWIDEGSSYLLAEQLAAVLYGQLQNFEPIQNSRLAISQYYSIKLKNLVMDNAWQSFAPTKEDTDVAHIYWVQTRKQEEATNFIDHLARTGVSATRHYVPLHNSPAGMRFGKTTNKLSTSIHVSECIVRLPIWFDLPESQLIEAVSNIELYLGSQS